MTSQKGSNLRVSDAGRDHQNPVFLRTVPLEDVLGAVTDDSGDDITVAHTTYNKLENCSTLELWVTAGAENYVGSDSIAVKLYREDFPGVMSLVATLSSISTAAVTAGSAVKNLVSDPDEYAVSCTHYSVSGTFTVAANGNLIVTMGKLGAVAG